MNGHVTDKLHTGARLTGRLAQLAALALAACALALCLAPASAFAVKGEAYDYTVRVFGGNQGTVDGASVATYSVPYGAVFSLDKGSVELADGNRYYVKGFRESGQDALHEESFEVTRDLDFVVAYGVAGDLASYTLRFVEYGTGRELAPDATYFGNVGDKPVAAFAYIEGYRPIYRNITGTLGEEGSNVWTFEYVALAAGENEDGTVDAAATGAAGDAAGGADAAAGEGAGLPDEQIGDDENPLSQAPATEEILDQDNPLGAYEAPEASPLPVDVGAAAAQLVPVFAIAAAAVVVALAFMALRAGFLRRGRRSAD